MRRRAFGKFTPATSRPLLDGEVHVFRLSGGREVSVIRHRGSYGGPSGLFEAAVFDSDGNASDLEGWLSEDDVTAYLERVGAQA